MPRVRLDTGPTGTNRVSLAGQHLVRYWRFEFGNAVNACRLHQRWTATTHIDGDANRQSDQLLRLAGAPSTVVITVRPRRAIQDRAHDFEAAIGRRSCYAAALRSAKTVPAYGHELDSPRCFRDGSGQRMCQARTSTLRLC